MFPLHFRPVAGRQGGRLEGRLGRHWRAGELSSPLHAIKSTKAAVALFPYRKHLDLTKAILGFKSNRWDFQNCVCVHVYTHTHTHLQSKDPLRD